MSELLWVAVPSGLIADPAGEPPTKAAIRVLVVPRLTGVDISEDGLGDWPTRLTEEAGFTLFTSTSLGVRSAAHRPRLVSRPRSEVWTGFFGGDAGLVNEYQARTQPEPRVARSYRDARAVASSYRTVARVGARPENDTQAAVRSALGAYAAPEPARPPVAAGAPVFATPDFHATVSRLREHPTVLMELGLVFELHVDVADLNVGAAAAGRQLSIRCDDPPSLQQLVTSPWTRYELDLTPPDVGFWPAPNPGSGAGIGKGLLNLAGAVSVTSPVAPPEAADWAIATFDVDGAVGNLRQYARDAAADPRARVTMPPVRSIGLALLRPERGTELAARVHSATSRARAVMADTVFGAEDLVLGYRVDVRRGSNPWHSLCEREVTYAVNDLPIGRPDTADGRIREEGHVKAFTATKDAAGDLHTDEVVLRWDGWNLAVPTPNLRGDTAGPVTTSNEAIPYRFDWNFRARPGRLPALRFADLYRMRVRIADITGGGMELGDLSGNQGAAEIIYRRHDPVPPPQLQATTGYATGAAIDRLVIRSDRDLTPEQLHAADPDYPLVETRILEPPTASLQLVEQHRRLDGLTDERSFALAQRAIRADATGAELADPAAEGVAALIRVVPGRLAEEISDVERWTPDWPDPGLKKIELRPQPDQPDPVNIRWSAGTLKVTLSRAQQATVELSSTIPGDVSSHLAITDHFNPAVPAEQTLAGRNPVVTPPRLVHVVHAVRRPLADPVWNLPLPLDRAPGDTTVVLNPTFTAVASGPGLHTPSTGRLAVSATWTEVEDVGAQASIGTRRVTVERLHSQAVDPVGLPTVAVRHEFGDTRHRVVSYSLEATSRFREYFKQTDPDALFRARMPQPPVAVLSSVRPVEPVVVGTVPAFGWQRSQPTADRIEHVRGAQRVRVEVARPWFRTGAGEQLAVVLAPSDASAAAASEFVSRIGRDPLFATPATPPRPLPAWFAGAAAARQVPLPELGAPVTVIPCDVVPAGDRWYVDIGLTVPAAAASYNPFLELAVVRYQPNSISGLELSRVVRTDRVPLLPDRRVVLTRAGSRVDVTVEGVSPTPLNRLEVVLESCGAGVDPETLDVTVDDPAAQPQVAAWRPVTTVVRGATGTIPPLTLVATPGRLRVRIRETERLGDPDTVASPDLRRRSVFVDTIVLPAAWRP
ncbi:hypothetical protein AB0M80_21245 [Amycolatopsis sp. NPDC051045]|uniref:hypothetical protein n=1 Tax=Amycolatopsis sp. NPDC051045 TaxID=3156922 RepID=UPI00343A745F